MLLSPDARDKIATLHSQVVSYFSRPGAVLAKAEDGGGSCHYLVPEIVRSEDGGHIGRNYRDDAPRCAVGCLLTPSQARVLETLGIGSLDGFSMSEDVPQSVYDRLLLEGPEDTTSEVYSYLQGIQRLHDSQSRDAKDFVRQLNGVHTVLGL